MHADFHDATDETELETSSSSSSSSPPGTSSSPLVRSLSMSRNLALSVVEEVSHMIRLNPDPESSMEHRKLSNSSGDRLILTEDIRPVSVQKELLKPSMSLGLNYNRLERLPAAFPLKRTTSLSGRRNDVLVGIVVSRWDNIVGPQCIYLWTEELTSLFYPGVLPPSISRHVKYVTDKTVDHHEVDGAALHAMRTTLCIVQDLNLAYMSISIRVPADRSAESSVWRQDSSGNRPAVTVPHSVSVLANLEFLQHFLLMKPLIMNWLTEFAPKVGVLLCKNQLHTSMINSWCAELCKTMSAVRICWWQKNLMERSVEERKRNKSQDHHFNIEDSNGNQMISTDIPRPNSPYRDTYDYLPPPFSSKSGLDMMLTSHLSTAGTTLVVGPDSMAINQVIRFLLCFSKGDEGYCSRYVLPTLPDTFMKGLFVQGLILGEIGERSISVNQINSNRYPYTYVEMSGKFTKIKQVPVQQHKMQRDATLIQELTALWHSTAFVSSNTELFPTQVKEVAEFVSKFLTDLKLLKPERRYARLLLFRRTLHAKAVSLITYLYSIRFKSQKEKPQLLKRLRETLRLDEAEYLIVQVIAERIRPGVLAALK